jgi:transposase
MKTLSSADSPITWAALIGFDWGDTSHAVALRVPDQPVEILQLRHSAEDLHGWLDQLEQRFAGRPVAVAIEATRGASVYAMMERPWIHLFPVHPATSTHQRRAFRPSGAKDDIPDARVLLSLLEHHRDRLRLFVPEDAATRCLQGLVQARRKAVDRRTGLTNQLTSLLKDYFPQALAWCGKDLAAPLALDFLEKWPTLGDLKTSKIQTIRRFYHTHNVRRPELIEERLSQIREAKALTSDTAILEVSVRVGQLLLEELRVLQKHIAAFQEAIARAFAAHPERALFRELPGAGANLAPRLLVALGTDRTRYGSAQDLQRWVGVAPVTERSGGKKWIHWRWNAPDFLRQSVVEWAAQTVVFSPWAKAFYEQQKDKGHHHWAILRALAFKWLRILYKCWQCGELYDEDRYLAQLEKRRSPIAERARQIAREMNTSTSKTS